MSADDNTNELTWLKEGGKKPELSPIRPQGDDAPSWLYEDTVPDHKGQQAGKAGHDNKAPKGGGVKWKQHINTKPVEEDSGDVDSDSCCCCFSSDPMLFAFQCFHITAGLAGLGAFVANIYVFSRPHITVKEAIIRGYSLIFCMLMVATELDWRYIVNKARFLDWWVLRGFFYTFIGFITCKFYLLWSSCSVVRRQVTSCPHNFFFSWTG